MPIAMDRNGNYGGPLVTQKYSPLRGVTYDVNDAQTYSALLTHRERLLANRGLWPANLCLIVDNWNAVAAAEAGRLAPLVVVSSNRSLWIAAGLQAAAAELNAYGLNHFDNVSDLRALDPRAGSQQSPPIYAPQRLGANPNRNVYIVVHAAEYAQYRRALNGAGITVVGWDFRQGPRMGDRPLLTGFGATRFAAIEFCKHLRQRAQAAAPGAAHAPWDFAWLFDDNVVALTSFPGFAAVQQAMTAAAAPRAAAGFRGGTLAETALANRTTAQNEIVAGRGGAPAALPAVAAAGIIQQAALWNIAYLQANNLNFGRVFVTSGEDLSLAAYFDYAQRPYFWYGGIHVLKEEVPAHDEMAGAQGVKRVRGRLANVFVNAEAASPPVPAPPMPLNVQPIQHADGGVQILRDFVVNRVLPNSQLQAQAGNAAVRDTACCQAVEQLICGAIAAGAAQIGTGALTASLSSFPANYQVQEVNRP